MFVHDIRASLLRSRPEAFGTGNFEFCRVAGQGQPMTESQVPAGLREWIGLDFCGEEYLSFKQLKGLAEIGFLDLHFFFPQNL